MSHTSHGTAAGRKAGRSGPSSTHAQGKAEPLDDFAPQKGGPRLDHYEPGGKGDPELEKAVPRHGTSGFKQRMAKGAVGRNRLGTKDYP